jgi:hypothetical protein
VEHGGAVEVLGQSLAGFQQATDLEVSHVAGSEDVTAQVNNVADGELTHILFLQRSRQMINSHCYDLLSRLQQLLDAAVVIDTDTGAAGTPDRQIITAWAHTLGLSGWYDWVPLAEPAS